MVKLYLQHWETPFQDLKKQTHQTDTKLLAISGVEKGRSIPQVACDLGLNFIALKVKRRFKIRMKGETTEMKMNVIKKPLIRS